MWRGANSLVMKVKISNLPLLLLFLFASRPTEAQHWEVETRGMDSNLRGVSVTSSPGENGAAIPVVWTSGSNGVIRSR